MKDLHIGIVVFPSVYQLDATAPYSVFAAMKNANVYLLWKDTEPITAIDGLVLTPTMSFSSCPKLDVLCVPGGGGLFPLLEDEETLTFIKSQSQTAKYVTTVCTGSILLAAAGGLDGYKATTHWFAQDLLEQLGIQFIRERVVIDGNRITSAGVSAGIDMALVLVGKLCGEDEARRIELMMEYDPAPPFKSGHPSFALEYIVRQFRKDQEAMQQKRMEAVVKAKERLK